MCFSEIRVFPQNPQFDFLKTSAFGKITKSVTIYIIYVRVCIYVYIIHIVREKRLCFNVKSKIFKPRVIQIYVCNEVSKSFLLKL